MTYISMTSRWFNAVSMIRPMKVAEIKKAFAVRRLDVSPGAIQAVAGDDIHWR
jgi:hypothetical protein